MRPLQGLLVHHFLVWHSPCRTGRHLCGDIRLLFPCHCNFYREQSYNVNKSRGKIYTPAKVTFPIVRGLVSGAIEIDEGYGIITITQAQTMSSLQIAELTGKRHANVMRDIRNLIEQGCTETNFGLSEYTDSTGRTLPCYQLTKAANAVANTVSILLFVLGSWRLPRYGRTELARRLSLIPNAWQRAFSLISGLPFTSL